MIPKILHQLWIGSLPPPVKLMETWKAKHPDYQYILWDEDTIYKHFKCIIYKSTTEENEVDYRIVRLQNNTELGVPSEGTDADTRIRCIEQFNLMKEMCGKADILRWEILHRYGGIFVDADSFCIERLEDDFLDNTGFAVFENENVRAGLVTIVAMGFIPRHPLCGDIVNYLETSERALAEIQTRRAWVSTGPVLLTRLLETGDYPDITVYPSYMFLPKHFTGDEYRGYRKVYAGQEWGSTLENYEYLQMWEMPVEYLPPPEDCRITVDIVHRDTENAVHASQKDIRKCLNAVRNRVYDATPTWIDVVWHGEVTPTVLEEMAYFKKHSRFCTISTIP